MEYSHVAAADTTRGRHPSTTSYSTSPKRPKPAKLLHQHTAAARTTLLVKIAPSQINTMCAERYYMNDQHDISQSSTGQASSPDTSQKRDTDVSELLKMSNCALDSCQLLQSLNSIILLLDVNHTMLFINRFGLDFFGYTSQTTAAMKMRTSAGTAGGSGLHGQTVPCVMKPAWCRISCALAPMPQPAKPMN